MGDLRRAAREAARTAAPYDDPSCGEPAADAASDVWESEVERLRELLRHAFYSDHVNNNSGCVTCQQVDALLGGRREDG